MKQVFKIALVLLIPFVLGLVIGLTVSVPRNGHLLNDVEYCNYNTLPYKTQLIDALENYYMCAHNIYETQIDSTGDTFDETDEGVEYWKTYYRVDSLLNLESYGGGDTSSPPYDWE